MYAILLGIILVIIILAWPKSREHVNKDEDNNDVKDDSAFTQQSDQHDEKPNQQQAGDEYRHAQEEQNGKVNSTNAGIFTRQIFTLLPSLAMMMARFSGGKIAISLIAFSYITRHLFGNSRGHMGSQNFFWQNEFDFDGKNSGSRQGSRTANSSAFTEVEAKKILGLSSKTNSKEINVAYRNLMKRFHPDKGGCEKQAARLNEARDTLLKIYKK